MNYPTTLSSCSNLVASSAAPAALNIPRFSHFSRRIQHFSILGLRSESTRGRRELVLLSSSYLSVPALGNFRSNSSSAPIVDSGLSYGKQRGEMDCTARASAGKEGEPRKNEEKTRENVSLELFEKDLLIVGAGTVGSLIGEMWLHRHPDSKVYGVTRSVSRHEALLSKGIIPLLKEDLDQGKIPEASRKFPFVVFCAPPSGAPNYAEQVGAAASLRWDGVGAFLFTSSSAVYAVSDNGWCDENAPIHPLGSNPRIDPILKAEQEAVEREGNVIRLAGLYDLNRGAHTFWLSKGTVEQRGDHLLNLIHQEDAASLCVAILDSRSREKVFMGCDNHALTRQELMDIVDKSGKFESKFGGFSSSEGPLGKRMCNDATRAFLNWKPKYPSFASFMGVEEHV